MNNLFAFGCSFTEDYNNNKTYDEYKNHRGGTLPKVWPTILAEKLGYNVKNFGKGGIGNDQIFSDFCENCQLFSENDIVIIGWTRLTRFRWADRFKWIHLMGAEKDMHCITLNTHNEILVNRTNKLFIEQIHNYEKLMIELANNKKFKIFFWSSDSSINYKLQVQNKYYLLNDFAENYPEFTPYNLINDENNVPLTIRNETNNIIDDGHLGEWGHIKQAELYYTHIRKYE